MSRTKTVTTSWQHHRSGVDVVSREGLAEALKGASVVVDVTNAPSFEDAAVMKFFKTSTHNLLTAEATAGVTHHAALSVVGTERLLRSGYLRAKFAQEKLIKESSIPYSIIQTTQFFEFVRTIADAATHGNAVRVPPLDRDMPTARRAIQRVGRSRAAWPGKGTTQDILRDGRRR